MSALIAFLVSGCFTLEEPEEPPLLLPELRAQLVFSDSTNPRILLDGNEASGWSPDIGGSMLFIPEQPEELRIRFLMCPGNYPIELRPHINGTPGPTVTIQPGSLVAASGYIEDLYLEVVSGSWPCLSEIKIDSKERRKVQLVVEEGDPIASGLNQTMLKVCDKGTWAWIRSDHTFKHTFTNNGSYDTFNGSWGKAEQGVLLYGYRSDLEKHERGLLKVRAFEELSLAEQAQERAKSSCLAEADLAGAYLFSGSITGFYKPDPADP